MGVPVGATWRIQLNELIDLYGGNGDVGRCCQWRRNYGERGVHCTHQVQDLHPLYPPPRVKDAAYVKILSKLVLPTYEKVPTRPVAVITVATCSYSDEYFEFGTKSILSSQFEMCLAETCQCRETSQNGAQLYPLQTAIGRLIALEAFESGAFNCIMFHSSLCFICMVNLIFKHTSCYHCTSY